MHLRLIDCPPFTSPEPSYKPGDCWYARTGGRRCPKCGCCWRDNGDGSCSLFDGDQVPGECCDNAPAWDLDRDTEPVWFWWAEGHDRTVKPAGSQHAEIAPEHAEARPMMVVLPNGAVFCLQSPTYTKGKPGPSGWKVDGELPGVTVSPSINMSPGIAGGWHGFIRGGAFT